jgi:hypothetical protein
VIYSVTQTLRTALNCSSNQGRRYLCYHNCAERAGTLARETIAPENERLAKQPIHSRSCRVCSRVCEWPLVVSPEQALVAGELIKIGQVCATKVPAEVSRCINCHCLSKTRERRCQSNIARSIRHQRRRTSETLTWSWRRPGSSYSISKSPTPHSPTVTTTNCHTTHPQ